MTFYQTVKTSEMDELDLILGLEGGEVIIEDQEDWDRVKALALDWSRSQGFYGRLYRSMVEHEEDEGPCGLSFPIYM